MELSQQELGKRIARFRMLKGFSQSDVARLIGITRSSMTQIELGNRKVNVMELQKLSNTLGFSIDNFLSEEFKFDVIKKVRSSESQRENIRISVPSLNRKKFTNVLLYLLERCAGKPNVGETMIYKMLYFADFNYYERYEEHLTGAAYFKLQYGPVPQNIHAIINKMIEVDKSLQRIKTDYHNFKQTRYIPLEKANLQELKASEKDVLDKVIDQFSDWSAAAISDYSHQDLPWLVSTFGEEIDYELALYRVAPYSVRNYEEEETNDHDH